MAEIILNEREWVEQIISAQSLGDTPTTTLGRMARYYYAKGYKRKAIARLLEEHLVRCNPYINLSRWHDTIDHYANEGSKYPLIEIDCIEITQPELDVISSVDGIMPQKLLFTLLCLAKYGNAVNAKNGGWVNQDAKYIFALANIVLTRKRQSLLINELWNAELVGFSHIVDNTNLLVKYIKDGPVAMQITDFRNLGNQYLQHRGEPYFCCQECGLVVRRSTNNQKYCKACAASINAQRALSRRLDTVIA